MSAPIRAALNRFLSWLLGEYRSEYQEWPHGYPETWPTSVKRQ